MRDAVKYPDVEVQLSLEDGNVFAIIGRISGALKRSSHGDGAEEFVEAAMACGSYDDVLRLAMRTVDVS